MPKQKRLGQKESCSKEGIGLKIAVISDSHLGAKRGTERERDLFDQMREAIDRALQLGARLILMPGDIFHDRIPRQEVWAEAMRILAIPLAHEQGEVKLLETIDKNREEISAVALRGVPILALHGNHERRSRGLINPVEALEAAGFLVHLHHNTLVFDTPASKVAIHGMSNVPERYAKGAFNTWNPKPIDGAFNILMLHQSLGQYVFSKEEHPTLDPTDLPPGFDWYICGHIHYHEETTAHGKPLLFPGSTVRTQLLPIEAQKAKGFYVLELGEKPNQEFIELQGVRDFYYEEMTFDGVGISQLNEAVKTKLRELLTRPRRNPNKKPIIRIRLRGTLAKDASRGDFNPDIIAGEFQDTALVEISKHDLAAPGLEERVRLVRDLRAERLSIEETALRLLDKNLQEAGYSQVFDVHALYNFLVEDRLDEALSRVFGVVDKLVEGKLRGQGQ